MKPSRERTPGAAPESELEQRLEELETVVERLSDENKLRALLDEHVPAGESVMSVAPDAAGSVAGVARVEAARVQGIRFVLVPESARARLEQDSHLTEHLHEHFRALVDEPGAGAIFEASVQAVSEEETPALAAVVDRLGLEDPFVPMLDWSLLDLSRFLPGRTLFRPVRPRTRVLQYLDDTIEVVFVGDPERMDEAARVAADTAIRVTINEANEAIVVEMRRMRSAEAAALGSTLILVGAEAGDDWVKSLATAMHGRPGVEVRAARELDSAALDTEASTILLAERGTLPLPGCVEHAERVLSANERVGGVAVKLFAGDGSLEAAGGAAFADGSVAGIAQGTPATARWHEYVRPVAVAVGLVVLRPEVARQLARDDHAITFDLTDLSARLWASGWELHYQPDSAAVRALAPAEAAADVWPQAPDGLPTRPDELNQLTWRLLLAREEVGAVK